MQRPLFCPKACLGPAGVQSGCPYGPDSRSVRGGSGRMVVRKVLRSGKTVRAYPASRLFGGPGCFAGFALPGLSPGRFLPAVVAGIICIPACAVRCLRSP